MDLQEQRERVYTGRPDPTRKDRYVTYPSLGGQAFIVNSYNLFHLAKGNTNPAKVGAFGVGELSTRSGYDS